MTELHFMRPEWLWALAPAVVLALLLWRERNRRGNWHAVISADLLPYLVGDNAGEKSRNLLPVLLLGWVLASLAAAGPSWQKIPQPVHQKQDALMILLDLSYSMKATDLPPSRLDRARRKILDLLEQRREGQTGLVAYAGDAHVVTPLTDDTDTIANLLPALNPDMMPVPGSATAHAVAEGVTLLQSAGIRGGRMLLVTDEISDSELDNAATLAGDAGVRLSVMGVGTTTGAPIPLPRGGFLKDPGGAIVMPGLDETNLRRLAQASNGRYRRMQIDNSDLAYLLPDNPADIALPTVALERRADTWKDQGYLLLPPLLLLTLCLFRRGWLLAAMPVLFLTAPEPAQAFDWDDLWLRQDQQGQRALADGDYEAAAELFEDAGWAGTAAYRAGDYAAALEHFQGSPDDADTLYNRGNALARAGKLDEAIAAYRESLALQPGRQDAQDNLALLKQLKQQEQQQGGNQDQPQDGQQENSNQQDDQQNQGQQNQGQQNDGQASEQRDPSGQDGSQQASEQQSQQDNRSGQPQGANDGGRDDRAARGQDEQETENDPETDDARADTNPGEARQDQAEDSDAGNREGALASGADDGEQEKDQAMEQWLRRVPDDPSGLLREKFRYESERRAEQGEGGSNEQYW